MAGRSDLAIKLGDALRDAFADRLAAMTPEDRHDLVEAARRETLWRPPDWLPSHARKHGRGRTVKQYAEWAQLIKNRARTQVYAMIHPFYGTEGLAFIDPLERALVWFDLSGHRNVSCFDLDESVSAFLARMGDMYWRLPDTEVT